MKRFVVKRTRAQALKSVEVFDESESIAAGVAAELAEIEGLQAKVFIGADLVDVVKSSPTWFDVDSGRTFGGAR